MKYLLFDLDGTLTDPGLGITNSIIHALRQLDAPVPPREELYKFIGPPLLDSFERFCGFSPEKSRDALAAYREYFGVTGLFENEVYPGIPQLLSSLKAQGWTLAVATSKPEPYSRRILEHFELSGYFELLAGSNMDETRSKKEEVIAYALQLLAADPLQTVMVGDRRHDIEGAVANHILPVGVLYGYGDRQELQSAGAAHIAATVDELKMLLSRLK